jgi:hypothetical protein
MRQHKQQLGIHPLAKRTIPIQIPPELLKLIDLVFDRLLKPLQRLLNTPLRNAQGVLDMPQLLIRQSSLKPRRGICRLCQKCDQLSVHHVLRLAEISLNARLRCHRRLQR